MTVRATLRSELLTQGGKVSNGSTCSFVSCLLVADDVGGPDSAIRPDHLVFELVRLEELDKVWPRNVQKVGGLLSRELSVNGNDGYPVTVRQLPQHFEEEGQDLPGDLCLGSFVIE